MNILATQFDLQSRSLDIFLAGCKGPHCKNCHNPESHNFELGTPFVVGELWASLETKVTRFPKLVTRFRVIGGEPLDQPTEELHELLEMLSEFRREIWLFTRYELREVPQLVQPLCDYIKCGRYEEQKKKKNVQHGVELASSNQRIYKRGEDY